MKTVYVVTAHNLYQGNQHSYVVGVYEDEADVKKASNIEEMNRGGKYECRFSKYELNELPENLTQMKRFNKPKEKLNIMKLEVNHSLREILFDLFLDAYELGVVAKDMSDLDYINFRKELINKTIQEINNISTE